MFAWLRRGRTRPAGQSGPVNPPGEAERLLRRLDFTVIRRLDGLRQGEHRNAAYGAGLDLAELREYQPGDDVRLLDWNVTARMSQAYVRQYHEDREISAWLVLDLTASTDFGSALQTKRELILDLAGTLARLLTARGDRVGALLYTGEKGTESEAAARLRARAARARAARARWWSPGRRAEPERPPAEMVPAGGGRVHTLRLLQRTLDAIQRVRPAGTARPPEHSDLGRTLEQAFRTARQRSLVIVISDFLDVFDSASPLPGDVPDSASYGSYGTGRRLYGGAALNRPVAGWERALAPLARRHEVVGIWVRDPREIELPDVGVVTFEDAETGEQLTVDTSQKALRAAYAELAARRAARMEQAFARAGAALWPVSTGEALVPALVRFLEQRRKVAIGLQRLLAG